MPDPAPEIQSPGDFIREELKLRKWTQADLATILNRPLPTINRILQGKHGLMPEMALALAAVFDVSPEVWMDRESRYRLSLADEIDPEIQRRARLYELAPINDLRKRGWIDPKPALGNTESGVLDLLQMKTVEDEPKVSALMRRTNASAPTLSAAQRAWCFRVLQLAAGQKAATFNPKKMDACEAALRQLATSPEATKDVPAALLSFGIRFAVVEHLTGTRIDGGTLWLDAKKPVVGMSLRYDRIDGFWFTLFHELSHVRHRDDLSIDSQQSANEESGKNQKPEFERRADKDAMEILVPPKQLTAFVRKARPTFSSDDIIQFAQKIGVHPGIVVGQLQHRGDIGYQSQRAMLAKIRDIVTSVALTDGWGRIAAAPR